MPNSARIQSQSSAARQLLALLQVGRINRAEYDIISARLVKDRSQHSTFLTTHTGRESLIVNNITLASPTYDELTPTSRVLNIAELLEEILSFLPPRFLISTIPRVSRGFSNTLESSKPLRRKMFREPDHTPGVTTLLPKMQGNSPAHADGRPRPPFVLNLRPHYRHVGEQLREHLTIELEVESHLQVVARSSTLRETSMLRMTLFRCALGRVQWVLRLGMSYHARDSGANSEVLYAT